MLQELILYSKDPKDNVECYLGDGIILFLLNHTEKCIFSVRIYVI